MPRVDHVVVNEYDETWEPPDDCGVVVSHLHYDYPTASLLKKISSQQQVPVLVLADGILEFRNTFQNPRVAPGSLFMPVHGHKIACLGPAQARQVAAWGNPGKPEVVGLPRLDEVSSSRNSGHDDAPAPEGSLHQPGSPWRVLIATARHPGFTDLQLAAVRQSLVDLRNWFACHPVIGNRLIEPVWRLTGNLAESIGIPFAESSTRPLIDVMQEVQAVISTPSTLLLESMLLGRATATLDYTNSPKYVPTAWNISAENQISAAVADMIDPPAARILFQKMSLADNLQYAEPATERMVKLIQAMITERQDAKNGNRAIRFPGQLLSPPLAPPVPDESVTMSDVFPNITGFRVTDREALVTENDQLFRHIHDLEQTIDQLRARVAHANQQTRIAWRHHDYVADQIKWLRSEIQRLNLALRISRRPTRQMRRLRVRASIAFQKWQFFVEQVQKRAAGARQVVELGRLFEITGYPKGNRLPPTIRNFQTNLRRNPQIRMWKYRPTDALLKKIRRQAKSSGMRTRARKIMNVS